MPELFDSEFDQMKRIAGELASNLVERLARDRQSTADSEALTAQLQHFVRDYSFIQYAYVTDVKGHSTAIAISDPGDQKGYKAFPIGFDYSNREWFLQPMRTGKLHITNVHQSQVTGQLIITVSTVITDANDGSSASSAPTSSLKRSSGAPNPSKPRYRTARKNSPIL